MSNQPDVAARPGDLTAPQRATAPQTALPRADSTTAAPVAEAEDEYEGVAVLGYN
ncbi:MAG: hypothetical protein V4724_00885 [Pseudomonadota bacterium]